MYIIVIFIGLDFEKDPRPEVSGTTSPSPKFRRNTTSTREGTGAVEVEVVSVVRILVSRPQMTPCRLSPTGPGPSPPRLWRKENGFGPCSWFLLDEGRKEERVDGRSRLFTSLPLSVLVGVQFVKNNHLVGSLLPNLSFPTCDPTGVEQDHGGGGTKTPTEDVQVPDGGWTTTLKARVGVLGSTMDT